MFGSTGDLASRKLVPALFALSSQGRLPAGCALVGFARGETDDAAMRCRMRAAAAAAAGSAALNEGAWNAFAPGLFASPGAYDDPAAFARLKALLDRLDRERGLGGNRLF